jgi:putative transposase
MNPPKCNETDYINFLIATQKVFSCTEAGKVQPNTSDAPSHDSVNRLLYRLCPDTEALRNEAGQFADLNKGVLIVDDSTSDKPYSQKIEIVTRHWSGKHHAVVKGINLVTMLWSDGDAHIPCDYRIYHKEADDKTKNNHFRDMLEKAYGSGFVPECVLFDSWYAGLENLKYIRSLSWKWLTRLKSNRSVNPDGRGNIPVSSADISEAGTCVHLKGYGFIKVFKIVVKDGGIEYWATDDLETDELRRLQLADYSWRIEEYHRGLKQFCGAERSQVRLAKAQRNHIGLAIRAFLRFEVFSLKTGYSRFEAKTRIIRDAVRAYLENPVYVLCPTA